MSLLERRAPPGLYQVPFGAVGEAPGGRRDGAAGLGGTDRLDKPDRSKRKEIKGNYIPVSIISHRSFGRRKCSHRSWLFPHPST